ncbi:putative siderophore transport system ATP-binding protein YusV [Anaerohalosphaera lusitana]|uniref:Putative siderophore transport system ATP-binding protein YusV n=1 Tax=Anaerohalosphaera lusitana TaxID=1936003 RepID=A0A1U9NQD8_9BACT|nr:ABC transporter ATP-binding protein [Anaerohalosphaera lusitana]AQT69726.1 putative siderophore transport system ATP-binding protein YusV [Anaerohalosphaera lusitana]
MSMIEIHDLCFSYGQTGILKDLSVSFDQGTFWAIGGPNGAGKSTLLNLMCGALRPESGHILIEGERLSDLNTRNVASRIAVVRQEYVPAFEFTVAETVALGRTASLRGAGFETASDKTAIEEAMKATDTLRFADRSLAHISSGERQRVFIAKALAQNTPIILLDEPTSFLDLKHQVEIYDLLKHLQIAKNKTIVTVTHDLNLSRQYCDHILLIGAGLDYCFGKCGDILTKDRLAKYFNVDGIALKCGGCDFFLPVGDMSSLAAEKDSQ